MNAPSARPVGRQGTSTSMISPDEASCASSGALSRDDVQRILVELSEEVREFGCPGPTIERIPVPSALEFLRDYVQQNRPVIITGAIDHWPALRLWKSDEYLCDRVGDTPVSVNVTPDGLGDAVKIVPGRGGRFFVMPEERRMPFREFITLLKDTAAGGPDAPVPYVSAQNNSLPEEFPSLAGDVEAELKWASEAFGAAPDAANLWCGDERAVTSFHKDHYENLYSVVAGQKVFTLLPPCDSYRLYPVTVPASRFAAKEGKDGFDVVQEEPERSVTWAQVDPTPPDSSAAAHRTAFPLFWDGPPPLVATVGPGETLYLPSMWHHHVAQRPLGIDAKVVAVNFWYDMSFDARYAYFGLVEKLARATGLHDSAGLPTLPP